MAEADVAGLDVAVDEAQRGATLWRVGEGRPKGLGHGEDDLGGHAQGHRRLVSVWVLSALG